MHLHCIFKTYISIYLDQCIRISAFVQHFADSCDLVQCGRNQLLTCKSRIYSHAEYHINVRKKVFQYTDRSSGIDGKSCLYSHFSDSCQRFLGMYGRFIVNTDNIIFVTAGQFGDSLLRMFDHHMDVQRCFADLL